MRLQRQCGTRSNALDGAPALADGDTGKFMNAVSLRVAPPRSGGGAKTGAKPAAAPAPGAEAGPTPQPEPEDTRNPLQKLVDKFK